jgi:hypothetical protein
MGATAMRRLDFRNLVLWLASASSGAAETAMAENWEDARGRLRLSVLQDRPNEQDGVPNWPPKFIAWIKETGPEAESCGTRWPNT